jgi:hypothetical protein
MATTYTLISATTVGTATSTITLSSIPQTYTDLVLKISARGDASSLSSLLMVGFNSSSINTSCTYLYSQYSSGTIASGRDSAATSAGFGYFNGATSTSNTFGSIEIYIPDYTASTTKQIGSIAMYENNASQAYGWAQASFANSTAAITSINLSRLIANNFLAGSSFYLYGIKNS